MIIANHKKRFNQGASHYTTDRYPGRGQCVRKVLELLDPQQDDVILDLGCGPGIQLIELAHSIRSGYGVDPAEEMIRRARAEAAGYVKVSELLPGGGLFVLGDLMFSDVPEKHQDLFEFNETCILKKKR